MSSKIIQSCLSLARKSTTTMSTTARQFHVTRRGTQLPFAATRPPHYLGQVLICAGFLSLVVGAKYYSRGYQAYNKEVNRRNEELFVSKGVISEVYKNKRFYTGGFDDIMSAKEAALILGCRESACKEQIMERYRTLIRQNHPDMGGSPYIASKVNEAKALLFNSARSDPEYLKRKAEREKRAKRRAGETEEE